MLLRINDIEMYSIYNKGKSVVAERVIRTLKNKIFKRITAVSKNVYFDVLDDILMKKILMKKIINSKLVIMLGFQNTKAFLLKDTRKIGQKRFLLLVKLKIQFRGHT